MEAMQGRSDQRAEALRLVAAGDAAGIRMLRDEGVIHSGAPSTATRTRAAGVLRALRAARPNPPLRPLRNAMWQMRAPTG